MWALRKEEKKREAEEDGKMERRKGGEKEQIIHGEEMPEEHKGLYEWWDSKGLEYY